MNAIKKSIKRHRRKKQQTRKQRKHARKNKGKLQLTVDEQTKKNLKELAKRMMRWKRSQRDEAIINAKFFCCDCKTAYCINFAGQEVKCKECHYGVKPKKTTPGTTWAGCIKKVQAIRSYLTCG